MRFPHVHSHATMVKEYTTIMRGHLEEKYGQLQTFKRKNSSVLQPFLSPCAATHVVTLKNNVPMLVIGYTHSEVGPHNTKSCIS